MAVSKERIKERLKSLYSGVNLSKTRLDELAARLSQKPADDADDAAIDEVLNAANDFFPFADIAKEDDRVRTLEANQKKAQEPTPPPTPPKTEPVKDEAPEWAKALIQEVQTLKAEKQQSTIQQQLKEKLKDVDADFYKYAKLPESVEEIEAFAEGIKTDYNAFTQRLINSNIGDGRTPRGTGGSNTQASKEEIDAVINNIM